MLPTIIGLVLFVLLLVLIGVILAQTILAIAINGVLIYLVGARGLSEINKGRLTAYWWGIVIAIIIYVLAGNVFNFLWPFTTFIVIWFIAAQIMRLVLKKK